MQTLFADAWYYIVLLEKDNADRPRLLEYLKGRHARLVTTRWVLTEVAAHFSPRQRRHLFVKLLDSLQQDDNTDVIPVDHETHSLGEDLYRNRPDKDWSLVDCISFNVMSSRGLYEALTGDHHFNQAGFHAIFAD